MCRRLTRHWPSALQLSSTRNNALVPRPLNLMPRIGLFDQLSKDTETLCREIIAGRAEYKTFGSYCESAPTAWGSNFLCFDALNRALSRRAAQTLPVDLQSRYPARWLLHAWGWRELIYLARNWSSRNGGGSQQLPLSGSLLPGIGGYIFRVRNVITRIFMAGCVVCT